MVYFGIRTLLLLKLHPARHWPHRRRQCLPQKRFIWKLKFFSMSRIS